MDRELNEVRVAKQLREAEAGSRESSRDKISPKIASIQQQLVNLTSPTSGEPPLSLPNNEPKNDDKDVTPFKIKSDTLSRKKVPTNHRESRSAGKDDAFANRSFHKIDSGFSYKGEVGIPPPPPPPRSSIPRGHPSSSPSRNFTNNVSLTQSAGNTRPVNPATFKLPLKTQTEMSAVKKSPGTSSPLNNSKLRSTSSSDSLSSNASVNTVKSVSPVDDKNQKDFSTSNKITFGVKLSPTKDSKKKEPVENNDDEDSNPPSLPPRLSSPVKSPSKQPPPPPPLSKSPFKDHAPPPSPKPALPSRVKKPSPVQTPQSNSRTSPSSGSPHNMGSRSLPQLPKPVSSQKPPAPSTSPKSSPKLGAKFNGHKLDQNGSNGYETKAHNGSSIKYKDEEKPTLPQKTLTTNDRLSGGRKLPIPPPTNAVSATNGHSSDGNGSSDKKVTGNGKSLNPPHLTNGHANHENDAAPTPPSPRSKPRGISGSPLRINQSPNKSTTVISSSTNNPTRKFEFGSKTNGFVEGSYIGNGHIPNGHGPTKSHQNSHANDKQKTHSSGSPSTHHGQNQHHQHHSEVYLNSQFDMYGDGTSVDGDDHVDYNDQHDNEVSYVVQNGVNGNCF